MVPMPAHVLVAAAHPNPYPFYAGLVAHAPFSYDEALQLWVAADAATVRAVLAHPHARVRPPGEPVPAAIRATPVGAIHRQLIRMRDDPGRVQLKELLAGGLEALEPSDLSARAVRLARQLTATLAPDPGWLSEFILRLPVAVVASLLGTPEGDLTMVTGWLRDLVGCLRPDADGEALVLGSFSTLALRDYVGAHLAHQNARATAPLAGSLSRLAGAGLADAEAVVANGVGLLLQSYEATAGLLGNTLVALATRPSLRARVSDDPALLDAVLREVLRFDAPIQNTRRYLAHDAELGGHHLRAGDAVLLLLAAANRDPAANPDPGRFEPGRSSPRCFTFGAGAHACPGKRLALAIAGASVEYLLTTGLDLEAAVANVGYHPLVNARVPAFPVLVASSARYQGASRP